MKYTARMIIIRINTFWKMVNVSIKGVYHTHRNNRRKLIIHGMMTGGIIMTRERERERERERDKEFVVCVYILKFVK